MWEAYRQVRRNKGAAGVDGLSVEDFEKELENNLYKVWNRMSSESYFPPPVRGERLLAARADVAAPLAIPYTAVGLGQVAVVTPARPRPRAPAGTRARPSRTLTRVTISLTGGVIAGVMSRRAVATVGAGPRRPSIALCGQGAVSADLDVRLDQHQALEEPRALRGPGMAWGRIRLAGLVAALTSPPAVGGTACAGTEGSGGPEQARRFTRPLRLRSEGAMGGVVEGLREGVVAAGSRPSGGGRAPPRSGPARGERADARASVPVIRS